jgi:hypothetical protein
LNSGDIVSSSELTYIDEYASNIIIKPYPNVNVAYAIHIKRRYSPVRVTTSPAVAENKDAPRENGSILKIQRKSISGIIRIIQCNHQTPAMVGEAPKT